MRERPTARTVLRYAALQLPGIVLAGLAALAAVTWLALPAKLAVLCVALWIAKDVAFFPFVWRAYAERERHLHDVRGRMGVAESDLDPRGMVLLGHERWRARCMDREGRIRAGARVRVIALRGLEAQVAPLDEDEGEPERDG